MKSTKSASALSKRRAEPAPAPAPKPAPAPEPRKEREPQIRPQKYRRRRLLKRFTAFRPIERSDLQYVGAAWRKGALEELHEVFRDQEMDAERFGEVFQQFVVELFQVALTLFAETPMGRIPVGVFLGLIPYPGKALMFAGEMVWFPWASDRNRLETTVGLLDQLRTDWTVIEFARAKDRAFFDVICRYGVMKRIGTTDDIYEQPAPTYQTRKPGTDRKWQPPHF